MLSEEGKDDGGEGEQSLLSESQKKLEDHHDKEGHVKVPQQYPPEEQISHVCKLHQHQDEAGGHDQLLCQVRPWQYLPVWRQF